MKLSGSPSMLGQKRVIAARGVRRATAPRRSLYEKYGWNGILSVSELSPVGLVEPVSCRNSK